jgi:hypothetical protein
MAQRCQCANIQSKLPVPPDSPADSPGLSYLPITRLLRRFDSISLTELNDSVPLLDRLDTKYLLSSAQLQEILPTLAAEYRILDIDGRRLHQYQTRYFDTKALDFYWQHHDGYPLRRKVRSRIYVDSGLAFFEIKEKDLTGRTVKIRARTDALLAQVTPQVRALLTRHVPPAERKLQPTLTNEFMRITLAGTHHSERVTLDLGVRFERDGRVRLLPGVVVAEINQNPLDQHSPFIQRMRERQIQPRSLSNYCIGVAMLVPEVGHQAFDEALAAIAQLTHRGASAGESPRDLTTAV